MQISFVSETVENSQRRLVGLKTRRKIGSLSNHRLFLSRTLADSITVCSHALDLLIEPVAYLRIPDFSDQQIYPTLDTLNSCDAT
jgi:hypothetical protein